MPAATGFAEGKSRTQVIDALEKDGAHRQAAETVAKHGEAFKKAEFQKWARGATALCAGLAVLESRLLQAHILAANAGGPHVVTCRFIIVGAWTFLKGLWRSMAG
jgi:DnaJ-domain-containing protein 1